VCVCLYYDCTYVCVCVCVYVICVCAICVCAMCVCVMCVSVYLYYDRTYACICTTIARMCVCLCACGPTTVSLEKVVASDMQWLRLVGSLKLKVSFAKEPYKRDDIL